MSENETCPARKAIQSLARHPNHRNELALALDRALYDRRPVQSHVHARDLFRLEVIALLAVGVGVDGASELDTMCLNENHVLVVSEVEGFVDENTSRGQEREDVSVDDTPLIKEEIAFIQRKCDTKQLPCLVKDQEVEIEATTKVLRHK
ncbi:hypothetical protein PsorP6_008694 [Peronosclerospora sorghi]|uniref:Uncharacterized protein n=1 Tax=Peronosclerospora sorghi TaxID=230839 RepID=A0ACC0VYH2_9STRA|nr:hypothetical protein PsorP6_008694 [Peronosclerospora sorghi]